MTDDKVLEELAVIRDKVTKLAAFEERLLSFRDTAARIANEMTRIRDDFESRIRQLEAASPLNKLATSWVLHAAGIILGALVGAFLTIFLKH